MLTTSTGRSSCAKFEHALQNNVNVADNFTPNKMRGMSFGERVRRRRIELGLSQARLAKAIGAAHASTVGSIERSAGRSRFAYKLARALGVTEEWLETGMPSHRPKPAEALPKNIEFETPPLEGFFLVPAYNVALSAGTGIANWTTEEKRPEISFSYEFFRRRGLTPHACRLMSVRGRSMEPKFFDGDQIMIDSAQTELRDHKIYAVCFGDEYYLKIVTRHPNGGITLRSSNSEFPPIELSRDELDTVQIMGRVVWPER